MTEQQAQSPIDDLFRKTLENLPESPAESGWDTPSDRVWQHVQANIATPRTGLSIQSLVLLAVLGLMLAAGLYWMFSGRPPATPPQVTPVEQPVAAPSSPVENTDNQDITSPKSAPGSSKEKTTSGKPSPRNPTEAQQTKPGPDAAQPLPGSKTTLPPNSTEAQKKKSSSN